MVFKRFPFQLNEEFAGMPVVFIKTYAGLLSGCQLAHVKHRNGELYRVFRWPDGQIYNVRRIK